MGQVPHFLNVTLLGAPNVLGGDLMFMREAPRTPSDPPTDIWYTYFKSAGFLYFLKDDGTERAFLAKDDNVNFTAKSIPFADASGYMTEENSNLFYDSALNELFATELKSDLLQLTQQAAPGTPEDGDHWHDSTQNTVFKYVSGREIAPSDTLYVQDVGDVVVISTAEGSLAGSGGGSLVLPADFFVDQRVLRFTMRGVLGTDAATPGTLRIRVKVGSVVIGDTTAVAMTASLTNMFWEASVLLVCKTVGASGTFQAQGFFDHQVAAQGNPTRWQMINTSNVVIDTTGANTLAWTAQWSVADAQNTITSHIGLVEVGN